MPNIYMLKSHMAYTRKQLRREHASQYKVHTDLFLKRLREARTALGLQQKEVAEVFGRDQSFISKLESGKRTTDFVLLEQLAHVYNKKLEFFATLEELDALYLEKLSVLLRRRKLASIPRYIRMLDGLE